MVRAASYVGGIRLSSDSRETRLGVSLRDRAVGFAETPLRASSPFGLPSLMRGLQNGSQQSLIPALREGVAKVRVRLGRP